MRRRALWAVLIAGMLFVLCGRAGGQEPTTRAWSIDSTPLVLVSLQARRLWVVGPDGDTVYRAPLAVGSGKTFRAQGQEWYFQTPTGDTRIAAKQVAPLWVPPDWHYFEVAARNGLVVQRLRVGADVQLRPGVTLAVRDNVVGVIDERQQFHALPLDEEIVFGDTLFIPPFGTANRRVSGVLGPFRLLLANGVGLHGTNAPESIGHAVTHGCLRLRDADITWLYEHLPIGTRVIIW